MRPNCCKNLAASSAAVDQAGSQENASFVFAASVQAVVTGTSTGTLKLQASDDPIQGLAFDSNGQPIAVNWSDVATVTVSGSGVYLIPRTDICYKWIRAAFAKNNGASGTITINLCTQGA